MGLALRVQEVGSNLHGDEVRAFRVVRGSISELFDLLLGQSATEATPPFYFLLAWGSAHLGDSLNWIRLPSIVLGTAMVPVVFALGRKAGGVAAGLVAAAIVALSPYAVFYSTEGRAYATMAFLVAVSTLALLTALERNEAGWWFLYGLAVTAAMYTQYTAVFVVGTQAIWALLCFRERFKVLALVHAGILLAYAPWLPSLSEQKGKGLEDFFTGAQLNVRNFFSYPLQMLFGHSSFPLEELPGRAALAVLGLAAAIGVGAWIRSREPHEGVRAGMRSPASLIALLAVATPVGIAAYTLFVGGEIYYPRNLTPSLPALAVLVGVLVASLRPPMIWAVAALVVGAGLITSVRSLDNRYQRPPYAQMVAFIDETARPGDTVISLFPDDDLSPLNLYSKRHYDQPAAEGAAESTAWEPASRGHSVFLFLFDPPGGDRGAPPYGGPGGRYELREQRRYPGLLPFFVGRYSGEARGRLQSRDGEQVIALSGKPPIAVRPSAATGFVEQLSVEAGKLAITGWATDARSQEPADRLIAFSKGRLVAIGEPTKVRPDVAQAHGSAATTSGFRLTATVARSTDPSRIQVFAVAGSAASELQQLEGP